jgi:pyruvate-formate lyase-activating enzyme
MEMESNTPDARSAMPNTLHFILNTECNAWDLESVDGSPGVCKFCYRAREKVATTPATIRRLLTMVREESTIKRIVFTGGDPLMPKENHVEFAVRAAKELGFVVNIHTNGLLLEEKYLAVGPWVDVFSLAIDGASPETADWERGAGYFERFRRNMDILVRDRRTVAFNTFVEPKNLPDLSNVAGMVAGYSSLVDVEYWLISQYRAITRDNAKKRALYSFPAQQFRDIITGIVAEYPSLNIFAQPTRDADVYPARFWLLGDGVLTVDTGNPLSPRNTLVGNCLVSGFAALLDRANGMRMPPVTVRLDVLQ